MVVITFWDFFQIFISPQVKRDVIIYHQIGIYKLSYKLFKTARNHSLVSSFISK